MTVNEKIKALREAMHKNNIQVAYIPNEDDHLSEEYTAPYFHAKSWLSGFSGESGSVVVTKDFVGLWTDGRYFTQAEKELQGSEIELMRMRQEGVPTVFEFIVEHTQNGETLAYDGRMVSAQQTLQFEKALASKNAHVKTDIDLVGMIWQDRPTLPKEKTFYLEEKYTGESVQDKIADMRKELEKNKCDILLLTSTEDPCWLFNIRGNDIPNTPVPYAYALLSQSEANYYIDKDKVDEDVEKFLNDANVTVKDYETLEFDLKQLDAKRVWTDANKLNTQLYKSLCAHHNEIYNAPTPIVMRRAIKNEIEIANTKEAHVIDGVAMVKFIKWVKEHRNDSDMSEWKAELHLDALRHEGKDFIEPSFKTISAYGENAAMMHYSASEMQHAKTRPEGFLLVDSGGTYKLGSTDITRTIAMGPLTDEMKKYYTLVLKGHLDLAMAKFLKGTTGVNLDILARGPLWDIDIDYQCGTGHGVGYALSVHEGPHGIRCFVPQVGKAPALQSGMVVTNEPGVYLPGNLGIRIENEMLVREGAKNFYGQWMYFENLTWCPYELEAIDPSYLEEKEIIAINHYHRAVYEKLSPYLNEEEKAWLKHETREIQK